MSDWRYSSSITLIDQRDARQMAAVGVVYWPLSCLLTTSRLTLLQRLGGRSSGGGGGASRGLGSLYAGSSASRPNRMKSDDG